MTAMLLIERASTRQHAEGAGLTRLDGEEQREP